MLDLVIGILIMGILGYVAFLVQDYLIESTLKDLTEDENDAAFEIDMEHVLMYSNQSKPKDLNELKRKLQDFKNRNKFYRM
ncbi:hypothetical protein [Maribacter sp. R86514]|uniref:hypothetical protein n=1 Tax=Maribacter sp. R86514 TaxID=3093854 RepID=UPI0037CBC03A